MSASQNGRLDLAVTLPRWVALQALSEHRQHCIYCSHERAHLCHYGLYTKLLEGVTSWTS